MTDLITGEETIGDVVSKYPQITHVLMKYGLHCVGCHVSFWESLEDGAKGHGMDDETFEKMIKEANEVAGKKEVKDDNVVHVTDFAIEKVKEMMKKSETEGVLRIKVVPGGCSGNSYEFHVEKEEKDVLFEKNGLKVAIDKESLEFLKGSSIDYIESLQGSGFKVDNPNISSSCGCGNSFS